MIRIEHMGNFGNSKNTHLRINPPRREEALISTQSSQPLTEDYFPGLANHEGCVSFWYLQRKTKSGQDADAVIRSKMQFTEGMWAGTLSICYIYTVRFPPMSPKFAVSLCSRCPQRYEKLYFVIFLIVNFLRKV